jgi:glycosyltransferase involved in cell wall biosynthesis
MRILMIAPEPFFEPRGTPFSEYHRIRALTSLGHHVDLVTYPFGQSVDLTGLRIYRCLRPPLLRHVRIGPSWAKVPLDLALTVTAIRRVLGGKYDAIHSHEEGGLIGVLLAAVLGVPHLYDMHSSLPQQLSNFQFSSSKVLARALEWVEKFVIRRSRVTIVICPQLEDVVRAIDPGAATVLIENAPGSGDASLASASANGNGDGDGNGCGDASGPGALGMLAPAGIRAAHGLAVDTPIVLYTGTFEAYQGLDLLFAAARHVKAARPDARVMLVGGHPEQVAQARAQAEAEGVADTMVFVGQRPAEEIPSFLDAADVLVSPRSRGTNTPLKIYQYLRAGRPIVATRLLTHTQVLDDAVAILTDASPEAFGAGIVEALANPERAAAVGRAAQELADTKYSYEAYLDRTRRAYAELFREATPQVAGGVA